jgi:hypothetical protein
MDAIVDWQLYMHSPCMHRVIWQEYASVHIQILKAVEKCQFAPKSSFNASKPTQPHPLPPFPPILPLAHSLDLHHSS